ncbi:MAG: hypothetical protein IKV90_03280, partial [Clostridia bacterium]|nr:hypothetical protein [Clostridia bacterium]
HPHQRVLDDLENTGAQVYRTDESGCITVCLNGETPSVRAMFEASGRNKERKTRIYRQSGNKGESL